MNSLVKNIRFYILVFSAFLTVVVYFALAYNSSDGALLVIRLSEVYGFISVGFLYFTLLVSPLGQVFPSMPFRAQYVKARRALGVSSFFFALIHAMFAIGGMLGGFQQIGMLSDDYLLAVILGAISLLIMFLLTETSFDFEIISLTYKRWKLLHRFIYLAGVLIVVHTVMIGSHFTDLSGIIPQIFFSLLIILLLLELLRLDRYMYVHFPNLPKIGVLFGSGLAILLVIVVYAFLQSLMSPALTPITQNTHASSSSQSTMMQMQDSTSSANQQFFVDFQHPSRVQVNESRELDFTIYQKMGNTVMPFSNDQAIPVQVSVGKLGAAQMQSRSITQQDANYMLLYTFSTSGLYTFTVMFTPQGYSMQQFQFSFYVE